MKHFIIILVLLICILTACDPVFDDALNYKKNGEYEKAISVYNSYRGSNKSFLYQELGWLHIMTGDFEKAEEYLQTAIELEKGRRSLSNKTMEINFKMLEKYKEGYRLFKEQEYQKAIEIFEKIKNEFGISDILLYYLASCYEKLDNNEQAQKIWKELAEKYKQKNGKDAPAPNSFVEYARKKVLS